MILKNKEILKLNSDEKMYDNAIDSVDRLLDKALEGGNVFVDAGTGAGKTYSIMKRTKERGIHINFATPYTVLSKQTAVAHDTPLFCGNNRIDCENIDSVVSIYDCNRTGSFNFKTNGKLLIIDEAHALVTAITYREDAIMSLLKGAKKYVGVINMTATGEPLSGTEYEYGLIVDRPKKTNKVFIYNSTKASDRESIIDYIDSLYGDTDKNILFTNDKRKLRGYDNKKGGKTDILTADNKDTEGSLQIMKEGRMNNFTLSATSVLEAGANILDNDIKNVKLLDIKDFTSVIQFCGRPRKCNPDLHIIMNLKERDDNYTPYNLDLELEGAEFLVQHYNKNDGGKQKTKKQLSSFGIIRNGIKKYEVSDKVLRGLKWQDYVNNMELSTFIEKIKLYYSDVEFKQSKDYIGNDSFTKGISRADNKQKAIYEYFRELLLNEDTASIFKESLTYLDAETKKTDEIEDATIKEMVGHIKYSLKPTDSRWFERMNSWLSSKEYSFEKAYFMDKLKSKNYKEMIGIIKSLKDDDEEMHHYFMGLSDKLIGKSKKQAIEISIKEYLELSCTKLKNRLIGRYLTLLYNEERKQYGGKRDLYLTSLKTPKEMLESVFTGSEETFGYNETIYEILEEIDIHNGNKNKDEIGFNF